MSLAKKLIWLGDEPTPPAEPRFLSRFQWRYKRFKPFTLPLRRINLSSQAAPETTEAMRAIISTLPPFPVKVMAQYGVAMLAVHDLWDDLWFMLGWGARGYDRTEGYDYVGGICLNEGHLAVVAERVKIRRRGWMKQENLVGIMWHELGHSFDRALAAFLGLDTECFSLSPAFRKAWMDDSSALVGSYRSQFAYFLQTEGAGESEAFAECFAVNGGHACIETNNKNFPIYFPRCLALVKAAIENRLDSYVESPEIDVKAPITDSSHASPTNASSADIQNGSSGLSGSTAADRAKALAMLEAYVTSSLISDQPSSKGESHV